MENKIYKVLANTTRRLIDDVKYTSADLVLLTVRLRAIMGIMEEKDGIQILTDEKGNQMIVLLDLDQEIIVNEDWVKLEVNEIVETWQKFNEIFGDELTEIAKKLMADFKTMSKEINKNICLMKRIQENIHILRNEFEQDTEEMQFFKNKFLIFCRMPARIDISESIDSARRCLEALDSIQRIFPELTDFNSTTEETPLEESRPFPNAWI